MEDSRDLHLLGVSFRTAPVAVREALSFNRSQAAALLHAATASMPGLEAVVLSTCNRTEFYLAVPPGSEAVSHWLTYLTRVRPRAPILRSDCIRYELQGTAAARHLFGVACGLDSAILGDVQILSQVKEAPTVAATSGTLGSTLQRVFSQAVHAGKRARRETTIGQGAASVGAVLAALLAERCITPPGGRWLNILIIGAGAAARNIGQHVAKHHLGTVTFINRTYARAEALAAYCAGHALPWSALAEALVKADVVIAATAAPHPILTRPVLDDVLLRRPQRPLLVIDTGLPRNVEPGAVIDLLDIDAIRERQKEGLAQRRAAIPAVERIVAEEVNTWQHWRASLPVESLLKRLYQGAGLLSQEATQHVVTLDTPTPAHIERIIMQSFKQLLHRHARDVRRLPVCHEIGAQVAESSSCVSCNTAYTPGDSLLWEEVSQGGNGTSAAFSKEVPMDVMS
jgi:glutamyl-tRNA reductase